MNNAIITIMQQFFPLLLQGLVMTLWLSIGASTIGLSMGTAIGLLISRAGWIWGFSRGAQMIMATLRAIPFFVQLLMAYYVIPDLLGIDISPLATAIMALGICSGAYVTQIVRSGLDVIDKGQWEAAHVLGFSRGQTLTVIIFPQMVRNILPAVVAELDHVIKSTSVVSSIGIVELTRVGQNIVAREMNPLPAFAAVALLYGIISFVLAVIGRIVKERFA